LGKKFLTAKGKKTGRLLGLAGFLCPTAVAQSDLESFQAFERENKKR